MHDEKFLKSLCSYIKVKHSNLLKGELTKEDCYKISKDFRIAKLFFNSLATAASVISIINAIFLANPIVASITFGASIFLSGITSVLGIFADAFKGAVSGFDINTIKIPLYSILIDCVGGIGKLMFIDPISTSLVKTAGKLISGVGDVYQIGTFIDDVIQFTRDYAE